MLRTKWYSSFGKGFIGYRACKNGLLGAKEAKIAVNKRKGRKGVKIRKSAISQQLRFCRAKKLAMVEIQ